MAMSVAGVAFVDLWRWTCPEPGCRVSYTRTDEHELQQVAFKHWQRRHGQSDDPMLPLVLT